MAGSNEPRRRVKAQALIEYALLLPVAVLGVAVACNALLLVHHHTVLQDAVRVGMMTAMDHRLADAPCSPSCANDRVRLRMRQVGAQIGLQDADIELADGTCGDGGWLAWRLPMVSWQPNQDYRVCADARYRAFGPFLPDQTFRLHAELEGRRL